MALTRVFEPISINGLEIRNRIARSAHGTSLALRGGMTDQLVAYHRARAAGGVGLTILEAAAVHPSTITSFANLDDSAIGGYRRLMDAVRPHGMRVFQQLWHGGHIYPTLDGSAPWGVSATPNPATGIMPMPMELAQIETLVEAYAAAALRCREGGIDGLEVHAAHGYLVMQFLNPLTNFRTDRYGGPLENRMRFLHEVLARIRAVVGHDYPLGVRIGESAGEHGIGTGELGTVLQRLRAEGLIDFVNASLGDYWDISQIMGAMDKPVGYQLASSGQLSNVVRDLPRMVIGRVRTLEEAEQIIREGVADIVHMTRAHIADPDIVRKTVAGVPEQVRPCIGCNQGCYFSVASGAPIGCAVNPAAGNELVLADETIGLAASPRSVLVVGGGPAGLEAARVAALRGHRVTLVEALSNLGGQVEIARRAPRLHAIGDITHWLAQEAVRLGVDIRLNALFDAEDVESHGADFVVIAAGSLPRGDGIQYSRGARPVEGFDLPHVFSPSDILTRPGLQTGKTAVIFDEVGRYEGLAAAEHLLARGMAVTFLTPARTIAALTDHDTRTGPALRRFAKLGDFHVLTHARLERIRPSSCRVRTDYAAQAQEIPADTVVFINARLGLRDLYDTLVARGWRSNENIVLTGDAAVPRDLQFAIADSHRQVRAMV